MHHQRMQQINIPRLARRRPESLFAHSFHRVVIESMIKVLVWLFSAFDTRHVRHHALWMLVQMFRHGGNGIGTDHCATASDIDIAEQDNGKQSLLPAIQEMVKKVAVDMPVVSIVGIQQFLLSRSEAIGARGCAVSASGFPCRGIGPTADVYDEAVVDD